MATRKLVVGKNTVDMILSEEDYTQWDTEELVAGRRRDKRGKIVGRHPKVVPLRLLQELTRRQGTKSMQKLLGALDDAVQYLCDVAAGREPADRYRIHACEVVINRTIGMAPQRVEIISGEAKTPYEEAGVRKAIVIRDAIEARIKEAAEEENEEFLADDDPEEVQ